MNADNMWDTDFDNFNTSMVDRVSISIKRNFEGIKFGPGGPSL